MMQVNLDVEKIDNTIEIIERANQIKNCRRVVDVNAGIIGPYQWPKWI